MQDQERKVKLLGKIIGGGFIGIIVLIVFFGSFTTVSPQEIGIVTRTGALNRVLSEGLHFKIPLFESVTTMAISEQKYTVPSQVYSKDGQTVDTSHTINYQLNRVNIEEIYRQTKNDYQSILIAPVLSPVVEEVFSNYTAQNLIDKRSVLSSEIKGKIIERVSTKGVLVKGIEFTFDFDDQYEAAIKNKQVQEHQALAQVNITAQEEQKKQQEILKSQALAEKTRLEAMALQSSQGEKVISKIYAEAALEAAKKWNGVLPTQMIPGQTLPFIQLGK